MDEHNLKGEGKGAFNARHMGQQLLGRRTGCRSSEGKMEDIQHNLLPNIIQTTELLHTKLACMLKIFSFQNFLNFYFFLGKGEGRERRDEREGREERLPRISDCKIL